MGDIHSRLEFWKTELEAGPFVQKILENGFRLDLDRSKLPTTYKEQNNKSARENMRFVRDEIRKLEMKGCIVKVDSCPCLLYTSPSPRDRG